MLISVSVLNHLLRKTLLLEDQVRGKVRTRRGREVTWGSEQHVKDLQDSLEELIRIRDAHPRTSKARYIYSQAVKAMRQQIKAAKRYGIQNGLIQEEP